MTPGKPAPPGCGENSKGKAAPAVFNVVHPPPPPPTTQPPSLKATGGKVCLKPASTTKEVLSYKSPPTERPSGEITPTKAAPTTDCLLYTSDAADDM
eukprot:4532117-Prorocentrum_lima.AAC.1